MGKLRLRFTNPQPIEYSDKEVFETIAIEMMEEISCNIEGVFFHLSELYPSLKKTVDENLQNGLEFRKAVKVALLKYLADNCV